MVVSDNGPAFTSSEFEKFLQQNGVRHVTTAPYHPSSNGLAERAVQTVKEGLKKMQGPLELRIPRFLFKYRVTPQTTTGATPAELLMGRRLRTHLDLLYPTTQRRVRRQQQAQKWNKERHPHPRQIEVGDRVLARNFASGVNWIPGWVIEREGGTMLKVRLDDGRMWRRHLDHLIRSPLTVNPETAEVGLHANPGLLDEEDPLITPSETTPTELDESVPAEGFAGDQPELQGLPQEDPSSGPTIRHSTRERRPPDRLM